MALNKRKAEARNVEPGMNVEATQGDLGEADVSKPKVTDVALDDQGNVGKLVVEKGLIFKKKLEIPAHRVTSVEPDSEKDAPQGKVTVDVDHKETQSLKASGVISGNIVAYFIIVCTSATIFMHHGQINT